MGTENGAPSNDIEFTNITSRNDAAANNNANSHPLTPSKGPWTHSANSYSRKETSPDTKHHLKQQTLCVFGILCTVVFIVGIALGVVIGVFAVNKPNSEDVNDLTHSKQRRVGDVTLEPRVAPSPCVCNPCACKTTTQHSITTNAPASPKANCTRCKVRKSDETTYNEVDRSVFAPLTTVEISKVLKLMKREGLVSYTTSITSNRASHVYLYPVDKSVALQFLDKGGTFPGRYAKVHVIRGARLPPDVMEYKVGPLHETDDKIIVKNLTADGEIDFNRRPYDTARRGVDCPERSSILYTAGYIYGYSRDQAGACLFEADGQSPLWRHGSQGLADHYLVIRYAMNLGNYDYFLEWQFHLDGHLETKISASGYLYGAFWDPEDPLVNSEKSSTPFGFRIADYLLGPIHDHAFSFKVDIDILGTKNSFETVHWKAGSVLNALQSQTNTTTTPGYFRFNTTRYLEHEILEKESGFVMDQMKPKYWIVVNEKERNAWNVKRGYRIISHSTSAEYLDNHEMFGAWEHLKYHLVVTKRKDSESHSTMSLYDLIRPTKPFKGLGNMMDNEPIRNEDLVLWVTEKFMHAPSSEDLPMTLQVNKGFSLKPFNYFDRAATFDVKGHYYPDSVPYKFEPCYENV